MLVALNQISIGGNWPIAVRCPACRQLGTFQTVENVHDIRAGDIFLGQRKCPNPLCNTQVFCIVNIQHEVLRTYPPQRIDFDAKGIPARIVKTFSEALSCAADELHVAAAIMIRRTLEELCEDKGALGDNLKVRIAALQSVVVLPQGLLIALDDLRLLGNDAAHVEAKTYEAVGKDELSIAIELTKEILKAVYQLDDLLTRLRALKRP